MRTYGEYCPVAMGAEAIGDRWTPLVLRELLVGSTRFSDIHRGVPRMSRSLLAQRLRQLERTGILERRTGPEYHLTDAGRELADVVWELGEWATRWLSGDPAKEHHDGAHALWRVRQRLVLEALPERRTVVQFDFPEAVRGRRIWLILDGPESSVCQRDEGFDVDLHVTADIGEFLRIWSGRGTWQQAVKSGSLVLDGPRSLVRAFPDWFALSPFAAAARPAPTPEPVPAAG